MVETTYLKTASIRALEEIEGAKVWDQVESLGMQIVCKKKKWRVVKLPNLLKINRE